MTLPTAAVLAVAALAQGPWLVVLGTVQDGGAPQAGCTRACCSEPGIRRHVACLGIVDPQTGQRWLIDATPDFADQLRELDRMAPEDSAGLTGILLTHAHIGHYTGLMHLGHEVMGANGVPVWAMPRMKAYLSSNGPWDQLVAFDNISLRELRAGEPVHLNERITVTPVLVPHRDEYSETVGFRIDGPGRRALYVPDIDKWQRWDRRIEDLLAEVDIAWLDGTFYADGELPGRSMESISHPFIVESLERFRALPATERDKVNFIHLNHTNPALRDGSEARAAIEAAGFHVAEQGQRFLLATQPSDPRAVEIADQVMERLGGQQAWDQTRYITWSFVGRRRHLWDKHAGRLRLERRGPSSGKDYVIQLDLDTGDGRAWREGEAVLDPGELSNMLKAARSSWINDAYWLVMPYKLKDPGVTLRDLGEGGTTDGRAADVLELTFAGVGDTPQNKYHVWVTRDSGLVEQWAFFSTAADTEPAFVCPWSGWTRLGRIMLSGDRGEVQGRRFELTDIGVFDELPDALFTSPQPIDWEALLAP
jgi:pyrroloquinoline quinone biosynthesis protein B